MSLPVGHEMPLAVIQEGVASGALEPGILGLAGVGHDHVRVHDERFPAALDTGRMPFVFIRLQKHGVDPAVPVTGLPGVVQQLERGVAGIDANGVRILVTALADDGVNIPLVRLFGSGGINFLVVNQARLGAAGIPGVAPDDVHDPTGEIFVQNGVCSRPFLRGAAKVSQAGGAIKKLATEVVLAPFLRVSLRGPGDEHPAWSLVKHVADGQKDSGRF